jgi:hypothetical protein
MVKIRKYKFEDRYILENMIKAYYLERKQIPPENSQILETIAFYSGYPQCGKIIMVLFEDVVVGYCIIGNMWKNKFSRILHFIDELYIDKNYIKYRIEVNLIEYLMKNEKIHSIMIKYNELNSNLKQIFKSLKFELDDSKYFFKIIEV